MRSTNLKMHTMSCTVAHNSATLTHTNTQSPLAISLSSLFFYICLPLPSLPRYVCICSFICVFVCCRYSDWRPSMREKCLRCWENNIKNIRYFKWRGKSIFPYSHIIHVYCDYVTKKITLKLGFRIYMRLCGVEELKIIMSCTCKNKK